MIQHHVLMGGLIVVLCGLVGSKERWVLENSKNGQRLVRWFGQHSAIWVLRGLVAFGMIFGALLAIGIIRPIQW